MYCVVTLSLIWLALYRYDQHRDQILREDDGETPKDECEVLYQYFSPSAYSDMGDGPTGFFTVYAKGKKRCHVLVCA